MGSAIERFEEVILEDALSDATSKKSTTKVKDITLRTHVSDPEKKIPKHKKLTKAERDQLVIDLQVDGHKIAWKLLNRWRIKLNKDDVTSIVGIALCEAALRFDPSYETSFRTFFFYHLRGVLIKEISRAINDRNVMANGRIPGEADSEAYAGYLAMQSSANLIERKTPEQIYEQRQLTELCRSAIAQLDNLEQEVIVRYYVMDQSIVKIADELGYCRCHLSRVKNRALKRLGKHLASVQPGATPVTALRKLEGKPAKMKLPKKKPKKVQNASYTGGRGRRKGADQLGLEHLEQLLAANDSH